MTTLRKRAEGQPCYLRFAGCAMGTETTVLCHLRIGGIAGIGQKPADLCALPACVVCHSILDGRIKVDGLSTALIRAEALRALCQWLAYVYKQGWVSVPKEPVRDVMDSIDVESP